MECHDLAISTTICPRECLTSSPSQSNREKVLSSLASSLFSPSSASSSSASPSSASASSSISQSQSAVLATTTNSSTALSATSSNSITIPVAVGVGVGGLALLGLGSLLLYCLLKRRRSHKLRDVSTIKFRKPTLQEMPVPGRAQLSELDSKPEKPSPHELPTTSHRTADISELDS